MLKVGNLTTEYRENPLGIDEGAPRFSWKLESDRRGVLQSAYQISVTRKNDGLEMWDSGKVSSRQNALIEYAGQPLEGQTRYEWTVRVWDERGNEAKADDAAWWETALMGSDNWAGEWITPQNAGDVSQMQPVVGVRKEFELKGEVKSARIYASALGIYALHLNGARVEQDLFAPGWTTYSRRIQYQTYDVTDMLKFGANCIGAQLADGWYRGYLAFKGNRNVYGEKLALIAQLKVCYADGSEETIVTDDSWQCSHEGPFRQADYYMGVHYDARREDDSFFKVGYSGKLEAMEVLKHTKDTLVAQLDQPVRRQEKLKPIEIIRTPSGETVLDMGQNMVGWLKFKVDGSQGHTVRITHAEVLDAQGNFYTENYRAAVAEVVYTLKDGGSQCFEPDFSFFGFRYVKLENWPCEVKLEDFEGVVVNSDLAVTAGFECSDERVNQLQHNILWGQKGNFVDVPTDCPQRDERLGWTGDAQVFGRTACINMDSALMLSEWLRDVELDQRSDGAVPFVVPHVLGDDGYGSSAWGDAAVIIPWEIYQNYGDVRVLEKQYDSMAGWVEFIKSRSHNHLWDTGFHFGDWLGLDAKEGDYVGATDKTFISTAYAAHCSAIMLKTAGVLGKDKDVAYYRQMNEDILNSIKNEYFTPNGRLAVATQTAHALTLHFGLAPAEYKERVVKDLVALLAERGNHLSTGFVGTPYLCPALTQNGEHALAAEVFMQSDYPSWLYPISKGATTMWEHWDGIKPDGSFWSADMNSYNHYAYGAIGEWMVRMLAGLDAGTPGYGLLKLHPRMIEQMEYASAWQMTSCGRAACGWKKEKNAAVVECEVPAGAQAQLMLEGARVDSVCEGGKKLADSEGVLKVQQTDSGVIVELGSGAYCFEYAMAD